jgi:catechol-2,3-dioxygenase
MEVEKTDPLPYNKLSCGFRRDAMAVTGARFVGVELYFEDLKRARSFYAGILGLQIAEEQEGHHTKFDGAAGFICLEKKGVESYPSKDKAVLFFEVADLQSSIAAIGTNQLVRVEKSWAVLHDPEGHNVLLLESPK